jgi:endonuclease YncB( thermonuclease family)
MAIPIPLRPRGRPPASRRFTAGEIRLTVLAGMMLGLIAVEADLFAPAPGTRGAGPTLAAGPVRVIDGDTFVHAGARIRIADIDTPEVHGRCPSETALAAKATARTRQLLAAGDFELHPLPSGRDEDRYGRKLRIVTRGGRSVGDVLVAEGLARTWSGRREPWCG